MEVKERPFRSGKIHSSRITEISAWLSQLDVSTFLQRLRQACLSEATELLGDLILKEQFLTEMNSLKAYAEKLPLVLEKLEAPLLSEILNELETPLIRKALFGNFRVVQHARLVKILENIRPTKAAEVFLDMAVGIDLPKKAAKVLGDMAVAEASLVVGLMDNTAILRLFRELKRTAQVRIMEEVDTQKAFELCRLILGDGNEVRVSRLVNILNAMEKERRFALLSRFSPQVQQTLFRTERVPGSWDYINLKKAIARLSNMSSIEAAETLQMINPERQLEILKRLDSGVAAEILTILAWQQPPTVAALLEEMAERILIPNGESPAEIMYSDRAICIRERMGVSAPVSVKDTGPIFSRYPCRSGWGVRRSKNLGHGIKTVHIEETLKGKSGTKHILIDLLELDPTRCRLKCCRSIDEKDLVPVEQIEERFRDTGRDDPVGTKAVFRKLGLVRLSEVVKNTGAVAGINGGFYFDYGHYRDSQMIGLDLPGIPGLCYGDLVGWFVSDGIEYSPPVVNRTSLVVTRAGTIYIMKAFMTEIVLPNGNTLEWDEINTRKEENQTVLFNPGYGLIIDANTHCINIAISRNRVHRIVSGGETMIPITGFVLSLPVAQRGLLEGVKIGDRVEIKNDFPGELGEVEQAISCGPQLVRDGQMEVDFDFEDFGEKDSLRVPFSLTRSVDIFDAARSFVMLKEGKLHLGAVSGALFGSGPPTVSAGMTFGELAQLAMDLGAEQALALDGGGSSSIVARTPEGVKVLNVPTGGSDVPQGIERLINTYCLFFPETG